MTDKTGRGRPRKDGQRHSFREGALYGVLKAAFPQHVDHLGKLNVIALATHLGVARFTLYQWLNKEKLMPAGATTLIDKSDGRLSREDLSQFVF